MVELEVDAGKVAAFARREPGEPTSVADWADRSLPPPSVRSVVAAAEEAGDFAARVRREAHRLGATTATDAAVKANWPDPAAAKPTSPRC